MKKITLLTLVFAAGLSYGQNVGINQPNPTNSLHISPITIGDDPLRVDNMQAYTSGDTTLMIIDQTTGIVRYVDKSDLGGMIGNILFQNSTFLDSLNNYVGGGGGTSYTAGTGIGITGTTINNTGDLSSSNEYNTGFQINGTNLEITDGGGTLTVPLSSFADGDSDPTNEIELPTTAITGQVITWNGSAWVAQNSASGADNWGSQVIVTGGTGFSGDGTTGNPLIYTSAAGTDDQNIQGSAFNATTDDLTIGIEGGTSETINLSSLNNDNDWHITGNSGTAIATNFIGTTDNIPLGFRTNNSEAMRILSTGRIAVNSTTTFTTSILHSAAGGGDDAFTAIHTGTGDGLYSQHSGAGNSIVGLNSGAGDAVLAIATGTGNGFVGQAAVANRQAGLYMNTDASGTGISAAGNGQTAAYSVGGSGGYFKGDDGVIGISADAAGTGVIGSGNTYGQILTYNTGTGGSFNGDDGLYGKGNLAGGSGVVGNGNNIALSTTLVSGSGGAFTGTEVGVSGFANNTTGSTYGVYGSSSSATGYGTFGENSTIGGIGAYGQASAASGNGVGVLGFMGSTGGYGVFASGDLGASGGKFFVIDHPMDPENKILKHACIESNEILNVYRGNVNLDQNGEATVSLPNYFTTLNINYSYNLTPIGAPTVMYVIEEVNQDGTFKIAGGNPGQKISWNVYAERNDPGVSAKSKTMEVEKEDHLKGKYINPEAYGKGFDQSYFNIRPTVEVKHGEEHIIESVEVQTKKINQKEIQK